MNISETKCGNLGSMELRLYNFCSKEEKAAHYCNSLCLIQEAIHVYKFSKTYIHRVTTPTILV